MESAGSWPRDDGFSRESLRNKRLIMEANGIANENDFLHTWGGMVPSIR